MVPVHLEAVVLLAIITHCVGSPDVRSHDTVESGDHEIMALLTNRTRLGRIFQFNKENSAIRVELDFAIPFLSIPVNTKPKAGETGKNYLVDVNLGALTAATVFSVAALIFIPKLFKGFRPLVVYDSENEKREERALTSVLSRLDKALLDHNVDPRTCTHKAVCWLVSTAVDRVSSGTGGSVDKIVDGITSNYWLNGMVNGTAMQKAIDRGRSGKNCSELYSRCPLTQGILLSMARCFTAGIR